MLIVSFFYVDAAKFKKAFLDARAFNKAVKAGGELVYAPVIVEEEEEKTTKEEKNTKEEKTTKEEPKVEEKK